MDNEPDERACVDCAYFCYLRGNPYCAILDIYVEHETMCDLFGVRPEKRGDYEEE